MCNISGEEGNKDASSVRSRPTRSAGKIRQITSLEPRETAPNPCNKSICGRTSAEIVPPFRQMISTYFKEGSLSEHRLVC